MIINIQARGLNPFMTRASLLVLIAAIISGCAQVGMYQAKTGDKPHGYYEEKINDTTYLVSYETYKPISLDEAFNYVLKRSAELAKNQGFKAFTVLSKNEETLLELMNIQEVVGSTAVPSQGVVQTGIVTPSYTSEYKVNKSREALHKSVTTAAFRKFSVHDAIVKAWRVTQKNL